ncbi:hypothetical protein G7K_3799-t1 [Saitoella complicata NRRL Y-17804]|uniref:Uncharacterized protein n=2 Tax=Saitoella complicata (strain BCRC 22490 / CBS 7301 / JCM 7358 / NBRC 10748 / NRRL Y-17804) TaxID=698492 RepID=A0A0E9NJR8_SAICN|nr:hypothetical protein G7K_3799-t1 [Saitoella complicata NRRL Y-17804]
MFTPQEELDYQNFLDELKRNSAQDEIQETLPCVHDDDRHVQDAALDALMLEEGLAEHGDDQEALDLLEEARLESKKEHYLPHRIPSPMREVPIRHDSSMPDENETRSLPDSLSTGDDAPSQRDASSYIAGSPAASSVGSISIPAAAAARRPSYLLSPLRSFSGRQVRRLTSQSSITQGSPFGTPISPAPSINFAHSRSSSYSSNLADFGEEAPPAPWEVVRWTKLKKVSTQIFSDAGRRNFGAVSTMAASGLIAAGTTKGLLLIFDFHQTLKSVIGVNTRAVEAGAVTSVAISADHTFVAAGHANGDIFTWELRKPANPVLHIPALSAETLADRSIDGHVCGSAVLHIGFLGTRHSAIVSADDTGMAFHHAGSRHYISNRVRTTRILGRYPTTIRPGKPHKASTVLAFGVLPLGSADFVTDLMGVVAMLTPYKLVVVSVLPDARTEFTCMKPKNGTGMGMIVSGTLAWHPASKKAGMVREPMLACSWGSYVMVIRVSNKPRPEDNPGPPILEFNKVKDWYGEEPIVALQWMNHGVLLALTVTQRLLVVEALTGRLAENNDLLTKQVLHADRFSSQLEREFTTSEEDGDAPGALVADAYFGSFRVFKQRLFLLCNDNLSVGTLLTWADRLLALVEAGDFVEAIALTTAYYNGETEQVTLGLPDEEASRKAVVQEKSVELIKSSLGFALGRQESSAEPRLLWTKLLRDLALASFDACLGMQQESLLFDTVFDYYEDAGQASIFIDVLEPYVLGEKIRDVPPAVVNEIIRHFTEQRLPLRLETLICHIQPNSLDIHRITGICKQYSLYDALVYVHTQALEDYVSPLVEFVGLSNKFLLKSQRRTEAVDDVFTNDAPEDLGALTLNVVKVFPYLSYTLTGRTYPAGRDMSDALAAKAKSVTYDFLFSGRTLSHPDDNGKLIRTLREGEAELTFPYLRLFLRLDATTFLQAMEEAFEDSFLNGRDDRQADEQSFGKNLTRQFIVNILLEVMSSGFPQEDVVALHVFIARNLPKYPQYLLLSGSTIAQILVDLCRVRGDPEMMEDCQLAVEHLLSVYQPADSARMTQLYEEAGFYRVLKTHYRIEKRYGKLLATYIRDEDDGPSVLPLVHEFLRKKSVLTAAQRRDVEAVVLQRIHHLIRLDGPGVAQLIERFAKHLHADIVKALETDKGQQFVYLRTLLEPKHPDIIPDEHSALANGDANKPKEAEWLNSNTRILYIQLLCDYDPSAVRTYLSTLSDDDADWTAVIQLLEDRGVVDGEVYLLRRQGKSKDALKRIITHLKTQQSELMRLLGTDGDINPGRIGNTLASVQKFAFLAIGLCEENTKPQPRAYYARKANAAASKAVLLDVERLWLDLLGALLDLTLQFRPSSQITDKAGDNAANVRDRAATMIRHLFQHAFTNLLTVTVNPPSTQQASLPSFPRILEGFLTQASSTSPDLSSLRAILNEIFSAYVYERQLLSVVDRLLSKDVFVDVYHARRMRKQGWTPTNAMCEACGVGMWGAAGTNNGQNAVAVGILDAWEARRQGEEKGRRERMESERDVKERLRRGSGIGIGMPDSKRGGSIRSKASGKGKAVDDMEDGGPLNKGKEPTTDNGPITSTSSSSGASINITRKSATAEESAPLSNLVVFACGHTFHEDCLEKLQAGSGQDGSGSPRSRHEFGHRCIVCREHEMMG